VRFPLAWLAMLLLGPWAILRERPQVLHAGQPLETGLIAWLLGRLFGLPYVVHCFGNEIPFFWRKSLAGPVMRLVSRHAARITAISSFSADEIAALGIPRERITVLYPGVEPAPDEEAPDDVRRQLGLGDGPLLMTLARLVPRKGQDTVIRAMPAILTRLPDARYLIVGTGPDEARLRQLAEECGVVHAVVFAGSVPHDRVSSYYVACDVVIHPNRRMPDGDVEGFGIVFLEANVFGKPVIGGNSGGVPDAVVDGETGLLVEPDNVQAVADAAVRLLVDRDLARRLGEQGQERARTEFSWETAVARLRAISEGVVQRTSIQGRR
jgi:phosphatidylinositol alpha-1,6-mannosyltransferase